MGSGVALSLPTPEIHESRYWQILSSTSCIKICVEKTKIKKKRPEMTHLKTGIDISVPRLSEQMFPNFIPPSHEDPYLIGPRPSLPTCDGRLILFGFSR